MSDSYDYSYARPYSGADTASSSLQGSMHDLFRRTHQSSNRGSVLDDLRTNLFFYGRDIITAACKRVDDPSRAEKPYSHFDNHYDVSHYTDDCVAYLDRQDKYVRDAYIFFINLAIQSELSHKDIREDDGLAAQYARHMQFICDAHDLTDPRLSQSEGLYSANGPAIINEKKLQSDICTMLTAQATLEYALDNHEAKSAIAHMQSVIEYKSSLEKLIEHKKSLKERASDYELMLELKYKIGKTFLYSRVTSCMGSLGTSGFRTHLCDKLYASRAEKPNGNLKSEMMSMVKEQLCLSRLKFNGDAEIKYYESIQENAQRIADDFKQITSGDWAVERLEQVNACIGDLERKITNALEIHGTLITRDDKDKLILHPMLRAEQLRYTQALYMRDDLSQQEQELLSALVKELPVPNWKSTLGAMSRIKTDACLVSLSRAFTAANAKQGFAPLELTDKSRALMREHYVVVKENAQDPNQLDVFDQKKKIMAFLIK
jgi:hypothetical protein